MPTTKRHARSLHRVGQAPEEVDRRAAELLARAVDPRHLPSFVPGEPWGLAALEVAHEQAPRLLGRLAALYGVASWDPATYRAIILDRVLPAWRATTWSHSIEDGVRTASTTCPVADAAARDPRACHLCQLVQQGLAREALHDRVVDLTFERLLSRGDTTCAAALTLEPDA